MERFADLQILREGGFATVQVSEPEHPFAEFWWPPGHVIGWGETFVHEIHHMLDAIANDTDVAPYAATFEDGYRCAEVCDAIARGGHQVIRYR